MYPFVVRDLRSTASKSLDNISGGTGLSSGPVEKDLADEAGAVPVRSVLLLVVKPGRRNTWGIKFNKNVNPLARPKDSEMGEKHLPGSECSV